MELVSELLKVDYMNRLSTFHEFKQWISPKVNLVPMSIFALNQNQFVEQLKHALFLFSSRLDGLAGA